MIGASFRRIGLRTLPAAVLAFAASLAGAQGYPNKPIRMLAPEPGGGNEVAGRIIANALAESLGQPVIIENRGAASGAIAGEALAKATPDGYTLMYYGSTIWLLPFLRSSAPFDPLRDFAPISLATVAPFFLYVHAAVPAKSVKELIALAKAKPGSLNYGSAGSGAATHLSAELFKSVAGVDIVRVAYKGSNLAATALAAGEVQLMFTSASTGASYARSGRLRILAVGSRERSALAPDVPTMAEAGLPGYEAAAMSGMFAPAKTPAALINRLNGEIVKALERRDVKERFLPLAIEAVGSTPQAFGAIIKADMAKWSKVIREAGIRE